MKDSVRVSIALTEEQLQDAAVAWVGNHHPDLAGIRSHVRLEIGIDDKGNISGAVLVMGALVPKETTHHDAH